MEQQKRKKRILAAASFGGHWIQLLRLTECIQDKYEIIYLSTNTDCIDMIPGGKYINVCDFNRNNAWIAFKTAFTTFKEILRYKPDVIITTGAAPGLIAIIIGRILSKKTIWIDSIANSASMSGSGKIASHIAHHTFTQWEKLAGGRVRYYGNVLGI